MWPSEPGHLPHEAGQWRIPRPSLYTEPRPAPAPSASTSSTSSTQSVASGNLLLTAADLGALRCGAGVALGKGAGAAPDAQSVASSTHFTVVTGPERKERRRGTRCWQAHRLSILVVVMSLIFLTAILLAVFYLEMRWRETQLLQ